MNSPITRPELEAFFRACVARRDAWHYSVDGVAGAILCREINCRERRAIEQELMALVASGAITQSGVWFRAMTKDSD